MDNSKTEIVVLLDASGSMGGERQRQALNGYNEFIQEQRKIPGECNVSLTLFNSNTTELYTRRPISAVPMLTEAEYPCEGQTATNDAVGWACQELGERLAALPEEERPGMVIMLILTDGEENASKDYDYERVKGIMDHQRDVYNWQFLIMGAKEINTSPTGAMAGMAGVAGSAGARGISGSMDTHGTMMFMASSAAVASYRSGTSLAVGYSTDSLDCGLSLVSSDTTAP